MAQERATAKRRQDGHDWKFDVRPAGRRQRRKAQERTALCISALPSYRNAGLGARCQLVRTAQAFSGGLRKRQGTQRIRIEKALERAKRDVDITAARIRAHEAEERR